jgi:uncharacterized protein (TIGR00369 family)
MTPTEAQNALVNHFSTWVLDLNLTVSAVDESHVLTRMPVTGRLERVGGMVSGQALSALADTSMILALAGHVGDFVPAATTDLHVQFLRPGTGPAILCRAHVARLGRSLAFARAEMMAEETEKTVALASATLALP